MQKPNFSELYPHEPYGVLADTHDNILPLERALQVFSEKGVRCILHAGDVISPETLEFFKSFKLYLVFGNNDSQTELTTKAQELNFPLPQKHHFFIAFGKRILLTHGDDPTFFRHVTQGENPFSLHYLIKGHTHFPEDYLRNNIRILNPGPLYRSEKYTAALFWPSRDCFEIFTV